MKKTRLMSMLCAIAMAMTLVLPVGAITLSEDAPLPMCDVTTEYRMSQGNIIYAKIISGSDTVERFGDEIFLNGAIIAIINDVPNVCKSIAPRSGWIASETGNKSDYTKLVYKDEKKSLALKKSILELGANGVYLILLAISPVNALALAVSNTVFDFVVDNAVYGQVKSLYYKESRYKHQYISFSEMTERKYYIDDAYSNYMCDETLFWSWA